MSLTQLLGVPDFTIPNGSTSPIVELFDFTLGPGAPPGTYSADVVLQDFFGDTSNVAAITEQVAVLEPPTLSLFVIGALLCVLLSYLLHASERAKIAIKAGGLALVVVSGAKQMISVSETSLSVNLQALMVVSYNGTLERWERMENFSGLAPWINHHRHYYMRCRN